MLTAKGFDSSVVTVSDTNVDAVINVSELSDTDKAQIEDIIKRKTGFANINILMYRISCTSIFKHRESEKHS